MSHQKKISSYFLTSSISLNKRQLSVQSKFEKENEPTSKILKDSGNCFSNSLQNSGKVQTNFCNPLMQSSKKSFEDSWKSALRPEFSKSYYVKLTDFVRQERSKCTIYPPEDQVFSWMKHCYIQDVKVVILGQDPYHGPKQAHGLCFSVQKGVCYPPSLENIFKELEKDVENFVQPAHGDLTGWAKQGVLLLNAVLTVRASQANSHKDKGWETFTDAVISWLNKNLSGVVFLLWGSYAQKKGSRINVKTHHVLKAVHPSPLSAYRGFFGCRHFSKTNAILKKQGKKPIDWSAL